MAKHRGESSKMGQAEPLSQAVAIGYSPRAEEAQSGAPTGKRSHKERLSTVETCLDVLEASLEELYQGQGRLLGVESSQEEAESQIDRVESLVDRLTEDTKDSVRHLHEVVAELTAKVPNKEQVDGLSVELQSRAKVPGSLIDYIFFGFFMVNKIIAANVLVICGCSSLPHSSVTATCHLRLWPLSSIHFSAHLTPTAPSRAASVSHCRSLSVAAANRCHPPLTAASFVAVKPSLCRSNRCPSLHLLTATAAPPYCHHYCSNHCPFLPPPPLATAAAPPCSLPGCCRSNRCLSPSATISFLLCYQSQPLSSTTACSLIQPPSSSLAPHQPQPQLPPPLSSSVVFSSIFLLPPSQVATAILSSSLSLSVVAFCSLSNPLNCHLHLIHSLNNNHPTSFTDN
ncbi:hypothetical protein B296_00000127 [Ensete ventricosum]|uniref:Uncharacterized protein n=1 Tax=Ensete ventricosum TaxID=4639 RepID=A0A427B707_ENSVE|nr:hypothetical protein B296_00000127 [Ensete ventricosum]